MQKSYMHRLAMLGMAGLTFSGITMNAHAVTADNVICAGCVQGSDIAANTITGGKLQNFTVGGGKIFPNISLGSSTVGGYLKIRTTNDPTAFIFEADGNSATRAVRIGHGGPLITNEPTNLLVIDPDFTASFTEPVMEMDSTFGSLTLGSGNSVTPGEDGELFIEDGVGRRNVWLYGFGQAYLGNSGTSGYMALDNGTASWSSIQLAGSTGTLTNQFGGDGLVKAWARINFDGTVASCYRCNLDPVETNRIGSAGSGIYEVDFTPVGTDISSRPWTCSLGTGAVFGASGEISCVQRSGDPSSLFVQIRIPSTTSGTVASDQAYTIVVY